MNNPIENTPISPSNSYLHSAKGSKNFGVKNVFKDGGNKPNKDKLKQAIVEMINHSERYSVR